MFEATLHNKWLVMGTWFIIYLTLTLILKSLLVGFIWDVYSIVSANKNIEHALTKKEQIEKFIDEQNKLID